MVTFFTLFQQIASSKLRLAVFPITRRILIFASYVTIDKEYFFCIQKDQLLWIKKISVTWIDSRHGFILHLVDCTDWPKQGSPPFEGTGLLQDLFLVFSPPPHKRLHFPQAPQIPQPPFTKRSENEFKNIPQYKASVLR